MMMQAQLELVVEDLRCGLKLAKSNVASFFLATLGMMLVVVVIVAVAFLPAVVLAGLVSPPFWLRAGTNAMEWIMTNPGLITAGGLAVAVPIITLLLTALGSVFGMGKEAVENGSTHAESAFSWFKNRFLSLAGAAFVIAVVVFVPQALVWAAVALVSGVPIEGVTSATLTIFSYVWTFFTGGLFLMVFPGIVNGKGVQEAVVDSVRLAREQFDRVFGLWTGLVVVWMISIMPGMIIGTIAVPTHSIATLAVWGIVGLWNVLAVAAWFFLLYPAAIISVVRVYNAVTGKEVAAGHQQAPEIPIV